MAYKIVNMWTPQSLYAFKCPYAMQPTMIAVHNTGNSASARNEVAYMNSNSNYVSFHVAIDDKEAVQAIPFSRNAFHTGDGTAIGSGNRNAIGIEICYSLDNGYGGQKSDRYIQAEKNAALYIAYVLHVYGWGTDRMHPHHWYSGKDCPHKMRATGTYNDFVVMVEDYLTDIKAGNKPTVNTKKYKKQPVKKKAPQGFQRNKYGTLWKNHRGTFKNGNQSIQARYVGPFLLTNNKAGRLPTGAVIEYDEILFQDGYKWIGYTGYDGKRIYLPVGTWNGNSELKVSELWGTML
ncbi:hypothetical protein CD133_10165 [Staphylococcus massiliensis CCUG 55927]|uniref:SH3 domain-containing protein n=1 Tax=Staphylococcus massiliensis TaxID=555791 RepID=UPI0002EA670D|nr:SH3 domain-containing protein [Staphylococcus massiliensis]PNZ97782.1 hypothetical protein CD133_10165 [Staphylococcus massiliensis CCUG 55927]